MFPFRQRVPQGRRVLGALHGCILWGGFLLPAEDAQRPSAVVVAPARLLFYAHEGLVELRAMSGMQAADAAPLDPGAVQEAIAATLAWLVLRCGLVYTDLCGPNVRVEGSPADVIAQAHILFPVRLRLQKHFAQVSHVDSLA